MALFTERIGDAPSCLLLTHGIYGAGNNWRAIAKKIVAARPDWSVLLVDLPAHGRSDTVARTVAEAAEALRALDVTALAGHSFGGKVVLAARDVMDVEQTWLLDSSPSARPTAMIELGQVVAVLELLERLPRQWARREDFIAAVIAEGHSRELATWLATNLTGSTLTMRLDTTIMRALLADYYARDLWASLFDPSRGDVFVVIADRAPTLDADARARLAHAPPHVHVHHIDAEHWLNAVAPDAVVALFVQQLRWH